MTLTFEALLVGGLGAAVIYLGLAVFRLAKAIEGVEVFDVFDEGDELDDGELEEREL